MQPDREQANVCGSQAAGPLILRDESEARSSRDPAGIGVAGFWIGTTDHEMPTGVFTILR